VHYSPLKKEEKKTFSCDDAPLFDLNNKVKKRRKMVWQSACLASAFLAPALAGWRFYSTAAEDDGGGAPDPVGRLLFTSAFALSALLLELLLAEVAGLLDPGLRAAA